MSYSDTRALELLDQMDGTIAAVRVMLSERPTKMQRIRAFRALAGIAAKAEILKLLLDCSGPVHD